MVNLFNFRPGRLSTNTHKWTAFVTVEHDKVKDSDLIESVKFWLHDTFRYSERILTQAPFQIRMKGWSPFYLPIEIKWKKHLEMTPTNLEYHLWFDGDGKSKTYKVKISEEAIFF